MLNLKCIFFLVKSYYQTNGAEPKNLEKSYFNIIDELQQIGFLHSLPELGLAYTKLQVTPTLEFMYNWHCIFGAMLSLGTQILPEVLQHKTGWPIVDQIQYRNLIRKAEHHFNLAKNLTEACHLSANSTASGLPFGQFRVNEKFTSNQKKVILGTGGYWLTSQLAETYFVLYRLTKSRVYQVKELLDDN